MAATSTSSPLASGPRKQGKHDHMCRGRFDGDRQTFVGLGKIVTDQTLGTLRPEILEFIDSLHHCPHLSSFQTPTLFSLRNSPRVTLHSHLQAIEYLRVTQLYVISDSTLLNKIRWGVSLAAQPSLTSNFHHHSPKTLEIKAFSNMSAINARKGFVQQTDVLDSTSSSTTNSIAASPEDTPRPSSSSTSLSSLESINDLDLKTVNGKLLDTYGNEFHLPDFTIKQIRDAIPAHCFTRSGAKGLAYVVRDLASLAATFYLFHTYVTPENISSTPARAALWSLYTVLQGLFGTGLWVLAHECGHQSFSPSKTLNDTVGWFCHSALLVPYFSWKISHGKHHKATGHLERDMVFVPRTRDQYATKFGRYAHELTELMEETPIVTAGMMIGQQLGGWPLYILANVTGHNYHERQSEGRGKGKQNGIGGGVNHLDPSSPLYEAKDGKLILLSDLGLGITLAALFMIGSNFGWANLAVWYLIPYLWVNHWLVAITFLQHTDPTLPHYEGESWNFARGAAATIDREFGFIGRHLFHGIIETHVLHHFVSTIPFYNADEATEAIKPIMGQHYRSNVEGGPIGFLKSFWRSARMCQWIEPCEGTEGEKKGVLFFRNRNGLGVPPQKLSPSAELKSDS